MLKLVAGVLGFPFLAVIALLHGVFSVVFGIPSIVKNYHRVILSFFFAPLSFARMNSSKDERPLAYAVMGFLSFAIPLLIYEILLSRHFDILSISVQSLRLNPMYCVAIGVIIILACGPISILYEIGRWYWKSVLKKGTSESAVVAKPEAVEVSKADDDDPNDKFQELIMELSNLITDGFTEEAIMRFIEKVTEIFKKDEIKREQYLALMGMVEKAKQNRVVPAEG